MGAHVSWCGKRGTRPEVPSRRVAYFFLNYRSQDEQLFSILGAPRLPDVGKRGTRPIDRLRILLSSLARRAKLATFNVARHLTSTMNSRTAHTHEGTMPLVIFDLDGTLIDSVYQHVLAWEETLRSAGIVIPAWKIHRRVGMSGKSFVRELVRELAPRPKLDLDALEAGHDRRFGRTIPNLQPLSGANELLRHLHRAKVRIAIGTTGNRKQTELLLKKLKLPAGTPLITGDDVEKAKPSPDIFVASAESVGVALSDCIVVGDSVWDLLAAGRKGALAISFLSGGYGSDELERAGAFRVYSDPADMLLHLEQLGLPGVS